MKLYFLGDVIVWVIFEVLCYGVGRIVIAGFTFGRVRSESFRDKDLFTWDDPAKASDGTYVLSAQVTTIVGFVVLALAILLAAMLYNRGT